MMKSSIAFWASYCLIVSSSSSSSLLVEAKKKNEFHGAPKSFFVSSSLLKVRGGSDIPADVPFVDPSANMMPSMGVEDVSPVDMSMSSSTESGSTTAPVTSVEATEESSTEAVETTAATSVVTTANESEAMKKWNNFVRRTGPAILLLAVMYGVFAKLGADGLVWLVPIIQIGMYKEVHDVMDITPSSKWFLLIPYLLKTNSFLPTKLSQSSLNLSSFLIYAAGLLYSILKLNSHPDLSPQVIQSFLQQHIASIATLVVILSPCLFWIQTAREFGLTWVLFPALLVIINDTMAYVFGNLLGKMPLLRVLSPKKTIEGFIGAAFSTIMLSMPLWNLLVKNDTTTSSTTSTTSQLAMALYVSIVAPFGGFLASTIKRAHDKKDFGTLIPGHGGIVDRLDCQLITAPFVFYYLQQTASTITSTPPPPPPPIV